MVRMADNIYAICLSIVIKTDYAYFFLHPGTPLLPFLHPPPCLFQVPFLILNGLQFTHQLVLESFYFTLPLFREALLQLFLTDEPLESKKSKFVTRNATDNHCA